MRTLASYAAYYERWSLVWESQALLRAEPVAGDGELGERFVALVDPLRYPQGGLADADVREIRRIKARVEAERMPRGADPALHTKLGSRRPGRRRVDGAAAPAQARRRAARAADHPDAGGAAGGGGRRAARPATTRPSWSRRGCWRPGSATRSCWSAAGPSDTVPSDTRELAAVAHVLGYAPGRTGQLVEDYLRATRRARAVVERVFYA